MILSISFPINILYYVIVVFLLALLTLPFNETKVGRSTVYKSNVKYFFNFIEFAFYLFSDLKFNNGRVKNQENIDLKIKSKSTIVAFCVIFEFRSFYYQYFLF